MKEVRFLIFSMVLTSILILSISAAGQTVYPQPSEYGPAILNWGPNVKYGGILKVLENLSPLNLNPFTPGMEPITPSIYEPLFFINSLDNGVITSLLGTKFEWTDNNCELIVTTRSNVEWSDGVPFTAQDVAFTFNYIKKYPALDLNGVWSNISTLESVAASGTNIVIFKFSKPDTPLFNSLASVYIVPEHIWSKITDPTKFTNPKPVGTGPFLFQSFNSSTGVLTATKNPNYWMKGRPYIDEVQILNSISNTTSQLMMLKHEADWSYLYVPDVVKTWVDADPTVNKYWWPVNNANILYLNTQKYPFSIPDFRKAIAMAINKRDLDEKAYFGVGGAVNQTALIPPLRNKWLDPTLKSLENEYDFNPTGAQELLASIGFKKNSAGQLVGPDGKVLPTLNLIVGAGWSDYITMGQIIAQDLKSIGINVYVDQEPWGTWYSSLLTGTYDMQIAAMIPFGDSPYYFYYSNFNPAFSASKIGESVITDYSRYTNPLITAALQVYSQTSDLRLQKQAMYTIERIMLEDLPFITLTNRTNFDLYSEQFFTGWPSELDPYTDGMPIGSTGGEMVLLNVHLK